MDVPLTLENMSRIEVMVFGSLFIALSTLVALLLNVWEIHQEKRKKIDTAIKIMLDEVNKEDKVKITV